MERKTIHAHCADKKKNYTAASPSSNTPLTPPLCVLPPSRAHVVCIFRSFTSTSASSRASRPAGPSSPLLGNGKLPGRRLHQRHGPHAGAQPRA